MPNTATEEFEQSLWAKIDSKTKPKGALGRIETLAAQIATLQGSLDPRIEHCTLLLFAGDHGIADEPVSAYPQSVTRQMVLNFLNGGAAANVFAASLGVTVDVVNAGIAGDPIEHPALHDCAIGQGTQNSVLHPAMSWTEAELALTRGRHIAGATHADALCLGEMGIANTSAASLVVHKITDLPLADLVGRGTGLNDDALSIKQGILEKAAARTPDRLDPMEALAQYGGFEIGMIAGAMLEGAHQRKIVLIDGFIATAAAHVALAIDPTIRAALVFAHRSPEFGHDVSLASLDAKPLLDLGMRLGEGTGALLAWPIVKAAAAMLNDMASFDSASVSGPKK